MSELAAMSLLPFVPSGGDYDASKRLFLQLGFEMLWENDGYTGFQNGGAQFILQKFNDPAPITMWYQPEPVILEQPRDRVGCSAELARPLEATRD